MSVLPPIAPGKGVDKTPEKKTGSGDSDGGLSDDELKTPEKHVKSTKIESGLANKFLQLSDVAIPQRRRSLGAPPVSPSAGSEKDAAKYDSNVTTPQPSPRRHSAAGRFDTSPGKLDHEAERTDRPRFNVLTLRQMFTAMDAGRNGHVTKTDWFAFLRNNLKLKHLILHGSYDVPHGKSFGDTEEGQAKRKAETQEMRKLLKAWRTMDEDGNGTLEWEEFTAYFRSLGMLLEYKEENTSTERLADILGDMHENGDKIDAATFDEFEGLVKGHTHGQRRKSLETVALTIHPTSDKVAGAQEDLAKRFNRRHSYSGAGAAPELTSPMLSPAGKTDGSEKATPVTTPQGKPDPARPQRYAAKVTTNDSDVSTQCGSASPPNSPS